MDEDEYKLFRMIGLRRNEIAVVDWLLDHMHGYYVIACNKSTVEYGSRAHTMIMITRKIVELLEREEVNQNE